MASIKTSFQEIGSDQNQCRRIRTLSISSSHTTLQTIRVVQEYENTPASNSVLTLKVPSLPDLDCEDTKCKVKALSKTDSIEEKDEHESVPKDPSEKLENASAQAMQKDKCKLRKISNKRYSKIYIFQLKVC